MNDKTTTNDEWRANLTKEEAAVIRNRGTEAPFTGKYWNEHGKGMYNCRVCNTPLFSSDTKFDSGTGWPSFEEPANAAHVELVRDTSDEMIRTEVVCKKCGAHLGHVFDDWTTSSGKRYCINSICLNLEKPEKGE